MPKYTLQSTGEQVEREAWRWEVQYFDGTVLCQFDDRDKSFHQFAEINQAELHVFRMVHDELPPHVMLFPLGGKLVHKYVNSILNAGTENEQRFRTYAFGYQLAGQNHFVAITPDNVAIHTPDLDNLRIE